MTCNSFYLKQKNGITSEGNPSKQHLFTLSDGAKGGLEQTGAHPSSLGCQEYLKVVLLESQSANTSAPNRKSTNEYLQFLPGQGVNSSRKKTARTHDIPNAKQLISRGKGFLTWWFQTQRKVKFHLLACPLHWLSLLTLHKLMNHLTGKVNIHHGSPFSTFAMERDYATNTKH